MTKRSTGDSVPCEEESLLVPSVYRVRDTRDDWQ